MTFLQVIIEILILERILFYTTKEDSARAVAAKIKDAYNQPTSVQTALWEII